MCAHRIVRTAIYGLLSPGERFALHSGAAKLLSNNGAEPEVAADHILLSGPTHDAGALGVLHEAGVPPHERAPPPQHCTISVMLSRLGIRDLPPRVLIDLGLAEASSASRCR